MELRKKLRLPVGLIERTGRESLADRGQTGKLSASRRKIPGKSARATRAVARRAR